MLLKWKSTRRYIITKLVDYKHKIDLIDKNNRQDSDCFIFYMQETTSLNCHGSIP
jgi:hypothetical protein